MNLRKNLKICIILFSITFSSIPIFFFPIMGKESVSWNIIDSTPVNPESIKTSDDEMGIVINSIVFHERSDAKVEVNIDFQVRSYYFDLYQVYAVRIDFKSLSSTGKWPDWTTITDSPTGICADDNIFDGVATDYSLINIQAVTQALEQDMYLRIGVVYDHGVLENWFEYWEYSDFDLVDDDTQAPVITSTLLKRSGMNDIQIEHNVIYDLSAIPETDYGNWKFTLSTSDSSGMEILKVLTLPDGTKISVWDTFNGYQEIILQDIVDDNEGYSFIAVYYTLRDKDSDRPDDLLYCENFWFFIDLDGSYGSGPSLYHTTRVEVVPFEPEKGLFLTSGGLSTTMITRYKTNGQKNKVTVSFNLQNTSPYYIRVRFNLRVYGIQNVNYKINTDNFYTYNGGEDFEYEGNQVNNLTNYFNYDTTIDLQNNDETLHFWIELGPSSFKNIDLLEVEVNNLELIDDENILTEDLKDLGFGLYGIIPDIKGIKSKFEKLEEFSYNLGLIDQKVSDGDLQSDMMNWLDIWTQYQNVLNSDVGGCFIFGTIAREAYIAHEEWPYHEEGQLVWRVNDNDIDDDYHYTREYEDEKIKLDNLIKYDSPYFVDHPNVPGAKYCGIGFIPGRDQLYAFQAYILAEVLSDLCYIIGGLVISYLYDFISFSVALLLSTIYFILGGVLDIIKNIDLLQIANGRDPPDFNYYEKPNEELISFPYENFAEVDSAIQENNPIALQGKKMIDNMLEYEKYNADLLSSINKFNTSYIDEEFSASELQSDFINEFSIKNTEITQKIEEDFISIIELTNDELGTDITHFDEEKLEVIENNNFRMDSRFMDFIGDYQYRRNIDDSIVDNYEKKEVMINNLAVADIDLLNNATKQSLSAFDLMNEMSNGIIESNTHTKVHISTEKLHKPIEDNEDVNDIIERLRNDLDTQAQLILDGNYFNANILAESIQLEAIQLYHENFRREFMEIYKRSYNMQRDAERANQIEMKLIDLPTKSVVSGQSVNFDFILQNLASDAFVNTEDNLIVVFDQQNLPLYIEYKIYENGIELEKMNEEYYCNIAKNEIKKLTLELIIPQNSNLELSSLDLLLKATSEGILNKYSELALNLNIQDDDIIAPEIEYQYTGDYTDGNPGNIIVNANDLSGLSFDPSGIYTVSNELGTYEFTFIATDDDNDIPQDSLTTTETIMITIVDDDILEPQISNLEIINQNDNILIRFDADDDDSGDDSGLSLILIYVDGEVVLNQSSNLDQSNFEFIIENLWKEEIGDHTVTIEVWDADDDRDDDSLMQEENGSFEVLDNPPTTTPPTNDIPSYNIVLIIAILGFTMILLLIRKKKSITLQ